ncbi:GumC family protein [Olivibacter jilunii]|uniref:GumC family protein n=1 Tax=Olivibacter jilunii TaxID=985016 RepID=UPI003F167874
MSTIDDSTPAIKRKHFSYQEYLLRLIRLWPIFLFSFILCVAGAYVYIRYRTTPMYHVGAKILIEDGPQATTSAAGLDLQSMLGTTSGVDNQAEILKIRSLMEALVRDFKLNILWYKEEPLREIEVFDGPYKLIFNGITDTINRSLVLNMRMQDTSNFSLSYENNGEEIILQKIPFNSPFELPGYGSFTMEKNIQTKTFSRDEYKVKVLAFDDAVSSLRSTITTNISNKLTTIIDLQMDCGLRSKGEYILNKYIDQYIKQSIQNKSRIADSTIAFIDQRILLVSAELNGIEQKIQQFMQGNGLANISAQSQLMLESNKEYTTQIQDLEIRMEMMDAVDSMLNIPGGKSLISGAVLNNGITDQAFNTLISTYNGLILERERLLMGYRPNNPIIKNADQRIVSIKENIFDYIKNTRRSLEVNKQEIARNFGLLRGNIRQVPVQERAFLDLSRQQQLKQELYLFLLQKREETALANTSSIGGITILDKPKANKQPFSPKSSVIYLGSIIIALLIPTGKIFLEDSLNTKIRSRKDVEERSSAPVIAELSHNESGIDLLQFGSSRSILAEQFRGLRTNIQFLLGEEENKVVLLSSGMPGEGKSFISLNIANVFAHSEKKVLLLEFDLRKPKLSKTYQAQPGQQGISNFIVNKDLTIAEIIRPVDENGMIYFAPCGPIPPNPSELIMKARTRDLFKVAREQFDIIIIDAPPVGAVTDAQLLNNYADLFLYVTRANYTPYNLLSLPEDMKRERKLGSYAIILNDVRKKGHGYSYYGYAYGHYGQEEQKKWWNKNR